MHIKVGDVVRLKGSDYSPKMTVVHINYNQKYGRFEATVNYFIGVELRFATFPLDALNLVLDEKK